IGDGFAQFAGTAGCAVVEVGSRSMSRAPRQRPVPLLMRKISERRSTVTKIVGQGRLAGGPSDTRLGNPLPEARKARRWVGDAPQWLLIHPRNRGQIVRQLGGHIGSRSTSSDRVSLVEQLRVRQQ